MLCATGRRLRLVRAPPIATRTCQRLLCAKPEGSEEKFGPAGTNVRHPGGVPDFIHEWSPSSFRRVGIGLGAASLASVALSFTAEVTHLGSIAICGLTAGYWWLGLRDLAQPHQALRRNFPVLIHFRYLLESIRPEIQQYLIESDAAAVPFSREMRTLVYQRAKAVSDTTALGTKMDVYGEGYSIGHINPNHHIPHHFCHTTS